MTVDSDAGTSVNRAKSPGERVPFAEATDVA